MVVASIGTAVLSLAALSAATIPCDNPVITRRWRELLPLSVVLPLVGSMVLAAVSGIFLWTSMHEIQAALVRDGRAWMTLESLQEMEGVTSRLAALAAADERNAGAEGRALRAQLQALAARLDAVARDDDGGEALRIGRVREALGPVLRAGDAPAGAFDVRAAHAAIAEVAATVRAYAQVRAPSTTREAQRVAGLAAAGSVLALLLLGVIGVQSVRNIRRRRVAEDEMRKAHDTLEVKVAVRTAQLSHLSRHLLEIAEAEKSALANELHDELGSNLTAINLDIASVATRLADKEPALAERLQRTLQLLHETVDIKRRIVQGLRPSILDNLGLSAAIAMHCEDFERRTGLPCHVECPDDFPDVDPAWAIALFRVAQEALNNVSKYAQAKAVTITLEAERDGIRLRVVDDGIGIEPGATDKPLSHGLLGMRERMAQVNGQLDVHRGPDDRGTVVDAFIPSPSH